MTKIIIVTMWTMSISFMFMSHPLSLGLIIILETLLISLITGLVNFNYWFSYILFLIMVGGMLILFIYMTSIASNEKFKYSWKLIAMISVTILIMIMLTLTDSMLNNLMMLNQELSTQSPISMNEYSLNKFLNWPSMNIMLTMIIYLLITLIMVVKIININQGPLRQKF